MATSSLPIKAHSFKVYSGWAGFGDRERVLTGMMAAAGLVDGPSFNPNLAYHLSPTTNGTLAINAGQTRLIGMEAWYVEIIPVLAALEREGFVVPVGRPVHIPQGTACPYPHPWHVSYTLTRAGLNAAEAITQDLGLDRRRAGGTVFSQEDVDGLARLQGLQHRIPDVWAANLSGLDLRALTLVGADLRRTNVSHANLRGRDMTGITLGGACFKGADLRGTAWGAPNCKPLLIAGVSFRNANLAGALFPAGSRLVDVDFTEADLQGVQMDGVVLERVFLTKANAAEAHSRAPS